MTTYRWFLMFIFSVGISLSCTQGFDPKDAELVNALQLKRFVYGPIGYYSTMFKGVLYAGSDDGFDYIAIAHRDNIAKVFKVRRGELPIEHSMLLEKNPKKWVNITKEFPFPASGVSRTSEH